MLNIKFISWEMVLLQRFCPFTVYKKFNILWFGIVDAIFWHVLGAMAHLYCKQKDVIIVESLQEIGRVRHCCVPKCYLSLPVLQATYHCGTVSLPENSDDLPLDWCH
jgi:hypothetical protein